MSARTGNPTMQRAATWLAIFVTLGIAVQAYLAMSAFAGAGQDALDVHKTFGTVVLVAALVAAVVTHYGFPGRRGLVWHGAAVPLILVVQISLSRADSWLGGVHGFLAVVAGVAAGGLAAMCMRAGRD